jgi:hypothetical protein
MKMLIAVVAAFGLAAPCVAGPLDFGRPFGGTMAESAATRREAQPYALTGTASRDTRVGWTLAVERTGRVDHEVFVPRYR